MNALEKTARKALIFAAGFGKRLAPLTEKTPKPLIEIAGKPMIQYHIERLVSAGISDLVVNTHWLADQIQEVLGDGSSMGARIHWSHEPVILDTGGGMKNALPLLGADPFLVVNADIWTDYPFANLLEHQIDDQGAHLVLVPNPSQYAKGDFHMAESGQLVFDSSMPRYTYAGIGLYSRGFISDFPNANPAFPLLEPLKAGIAANKVSAELYQGIWEDIGTLARLEAVRRQQ